MTNKEKQILEIIKESETYPNTLKERHLISAMNKIKQLLQPRPEKQKFVIGSIVKVAESPEYDKYYTEYDKVYTDVNWETIKFLAFPALARTIAQHIPEARKAVLLKNDNLFCYFDRNDKPLYNAYGNRIEIPFSNPSGKRIEVLIERE